MKTPASRIATGLLFAATARGFGRGPLWMTVPIGIVFAFVVWFIFAKGLQLSLPAGPLERLIPLIGGAAMDTFELLGQGLLDRAAADEPALRADRRDARHRRRRAARHRPGADRGAAAAGHLQARSGRLADHVRRHLLRRHVWRLDHLDPAQHAGRKRLDRHRARRQQDGPQGPRRPGAGHRRHRLLRRRPDRHAGARLHRAVGGASSRCPSGRPNISR